MQIVVCRLWIGCCHPLSVTVSQCQSPAFIVSRHRSAVSHGQLPLVTVNHCQSQSVYCPSLIHYQSLSITVVHYQSQSANVNHRHSLSVAIGLLSVTVSCHQSLSITVVHCRSSSSVCRQSLCCCRSKSVRKSVVVSFPPSVRQSLTGVTVDRLLAFVWLSDVRTATATAAAAPCPAVVHVGAFHLALARWQHCPAEERRLLLQSSSPGGRTPRL